MISFLISLCALVLGYLLYGKFVERVFGPDPARTTPAVSKADGVDFIPMPAWKVYMIQFLNIAGTGPIFGAIMGAKFGPSAFLWIVLGCIFAGAVHDYLSGMMSLREGGVNLPELGGKYLGNGVKKLMLGFIVLLLVLVGAVFVYSPAIILGDIAGMAGSGTTTSMMIWVAIIVAYYLVATLLPIDKIIGKIYPIFAFALIFMAVGLLGAAIAGIIAGIAKLPWWGILLIIVGIMLLISGPSCFIAWGKLRRRNLGPVLNANGWAINSNVIVNIPFGRTLTSIAKYPKMKLDDPYKPKAPLWWRILRWVLLALVIAFCALFFTDNLKCIGLPFHKEKAPVEQVEEAPEAGEQEVQIEEVEIEEAE